MIRLPCLEDVGLEDCALPPKSIKEAILKAASLLRSRDAAAHGVEGGGCIEDPEPSNGEKQDALTGVFPENPATCGEAKQGGLPKGSGDKVIGAGSRDGKGSSNKLVGAHVPKMEEGQKVDCVEGLLEDLEIEDKSDFENEGDSDEDEKLEYKPTLVEAYI